MAAPIQNPYVGPRTFEERDQALFFGREREARKLLSLVVSQRLVLFYAQSGAGKSSLINTRLIPGLREEGFDVLPVGRVNGQIPEGIEQVDNIFTFNLLVQLNQNRTEASQLTKFSLSEYLTDHHRPHVDVTDPIDEPARVLIIDQFEEIVTTNQGNWREREPFFQQLRQALADDPLLWVVLTLREDYIAALDPYARFLPGKLRVRFHMQRMDHQAALEAIERPAAQGGRPFASGVAQSLVDNLRQIRVADETETRLGQFVEPVQLQVVCYQLWENLKRKAAASISQEDVDELGDVDEALAQFYEQVIRRTLVQTGGSELELRDWFDRRLITEAGTRGLVYQGRTHTAGLPNKAVSILAGQFLLRAEIRAGGTWYELVHDRFIDPILQANRTWHSEQSPLFKAAQAWRDSGENPDSAYLGQQLADAIESVGGLHGVTFYAQEQVVRDFLSASLDLEIARQDREAARQRELAQAQALAEAERQRAEDQAAAARRIKILATIIAAILLLTIGVIVFAIGQVRVIEQQRKFRLAAQTLNLAEQARNRLTNQPDVAALLAVEAFNRSKQAEANQPAAHSSLLEVLSHAPQLEAFLHGHTDRVWDVAISPDGQLLASASQDGTVQLWDLALHQPVGPPLVGHTGAIYGVAFSSDGQRLATASGDRTIRLWNVATSEPIGEPFYGHKMAIFSLAFSPDNQILASASQDQTIIFWDVATGEPIGGPISGHSDWVWDVAFSPDGQTLASAGRDDVVRLWDVPTQKPIGAPLTGHRVAVTSVAFSPNGRTLASGGFDRIILWDVATHLPLGEPLRGHDGTVWGLAFDQAGETLASAAQDGNIILWDLATHQPKGLPLSAHTAAAAVAFSPDGNRVIGGGWDNKISIWNLTIRQRIAQTLNDHQAPIWSVVTDRSPDNSRAVQTLLASAGNDDRIILRDLNNLSAEPRILEGHEADINTLAFSPDGQWIASGSDDQTVRLWDIASGRPLDTLRSDQIGGDIKSIAFHPEGTLLAAATSDNLVVLWDLTAEPPTPQLLSGHNDPVSSVAFSTDGSLLASSSEDQTIRSWDVESGETIRTIDDQIGIVQGLAFHPEQPILASASQDQSVRLWNIETGQQIGLPLIGHTNWVNSVAFNPEGTLLASASRDGTIILWDVETGQQVGDPLAGHVANDDIRSVTFSPDGQTLISGADDARLILWEIGADTLVEQACDLANRNFSPVEWDLLFQGETFGLEDYRRTCEEAPLHFELFEAIRQQARQGDIQGAADRFAGLVELDPDLTINPQGEAELAAAEGLLEEGRSLLNDGNFSPDNLAAATEKFQEALAFNPRLGTNSNAVMVAALLHRGRQLAAAGDERAIEFFTTALDINPSLDIDPEAEVQRFITLQDSSQIPLPSPCQIGTSMARCDSVVRETDQAGWALKDRAILHAAAGDFEAAIEDLNAAQEIWLTNPNALRPEQGTLISIWLDALEEGVNPFQ